MPRWFSRFLDWLESIDAKLGFHRARRFSFPLGDIEAAVVKEWWTGRLALIAGDEVVELQPRYSRALIAYSLPAAITALRNLSKSWAVRLGGHDVVVDVFGRPFQKPRYTVHVDGRWVKDIRL